MATDRQRRPEQHFERSVVLLGLNNNLLDLRTMVGIEEGNLIEESHVFLTADNLGLARDAGHQIL